MNEIKHNFTNNKKIVSQKQNSEPALFILWENCSLSRPEVKHVLEQRFGKVISHRIKWGDSNFAENLTRFYGENLPPNSGKETHIGKGAFDVFMFEDNNPKYQNRTTSRGPELVNVNLFDLKSDLRELDGGGHRVHATINLFEGEKDPWLLFGESAETLLKTDSNAHEELNRDLIGCKNWTSLREVLETLNRTCKYVVLRNFDSFPNDYNLKVHGDIDFLCSNLDAAINILNAKKIYREPHRVHFSISINNETVPIDIRTLDDDYYDPYWSRDILQSRVKRNGFFIPSDEQHFYSLAYHALIHKREISQDYLEKFTKLSSKCGLPDYKQQKLITLLQSFMEKNDYLFVRPKDLSVYFAWNKISHIDQAQYFSKVEKTLLDQNSLQPTLNPCDREVEYRGIAFGGLTDKLNLLNQTNGNIANSVAILSPQFDAELADISQNSKHIEIICGTNAQKLFFERKFEHIDKIKITNICCESLVKNKFDLIMIPNTLDLFSKNQENHLREFLKNSVTENGLVQISFNQTFHIDRFIQNTSGEEKFFAEKIQGQPNSVNNIRISPQEIIDTLLTEGFNIHSHFGAYPNCNSPSYICNVEDQRKHIKFADIVAPSMPKYSQINKLLIFREIEKQMPLPGMFQGQIINLSKFPDADNIEKLSFAKFSIRNDATSTLTLVEQSPMGLRTTKKRVSGDKSEIKRVNVNLGEKLSIDVQHHSNFQTNFLPGVKLSTELEASLVSNDFQKIYSSLNCWASFIREHGNITSSIETKWNKLDPWLISGRLLDIGPHNMLINQQDVQGFDFEWQSEEPLPLGWYMLRNTRACFDSFSDPKQSNYLAVVQKMYSELGLPYDRAAIQLGSQIERIFQNNLLPKTA
jgi:hypothetical protein